MTTDQQVEPTKQTPPEKERRFRKALAFVVIPIVLLGSFALAGVSPTALAAIGVATVAILTAVDSFLGDKTDDE